MMSECDANKRRDLALEGLSVWRRIDEPDTTQFCEDGGTAMAAFKLRCAESLKASKRLWRAGHDVNIRSVYGMRAAASFGYGVLHAGSPVCSSIGAHMVKPAVGQWDLCESRGSCTVLREAGGATPPTY
jgi:hypothetical protein